MDRMDRYNMMKPIIDKVLQRLQSDDIILKGGYLLKSLYGEKARYTTDIDLTLLNMDVWHHIVTVVNDIMKETNVTFEIIETDIRKSKFSTGRLTVYRLQPEIKKEPKVVLFGLDASYHDISISNTRVVDFASIKAYTTELMLADKIKAIFTPVCFRRIKDFYDIYMLITSEDLDLDLLTSLFRERGGYDDEWFIPFKPENLLKLEHAWNTFIEDASREIIGINIQFTDVMKLIFKLVYPELSEENKHKYWDCKEMVWKEK